MWPASWMWPVEPSDCAHGLLDQSLPCAQHVVCRLDLEPRALQVVQGTDWGATCSLCLGPPVPHAGLDPAPEVGACGAQARPGSVGALQSVNSSMDHRPT